MILASCDSGGTRLPTDSTSLAVLGPGCFGLRDGLPTHMCRLAVLLGGRNFQEYYGPRYFPHLEISVFQAWRNGDKGSRGNHVFLSLVSQADAYFRSQVIYAFRIPTEETEQFVKVVGVHH